MENFQRIIGAKRSIIVAADVLNFVELAKLATAVKDVKGISAFKFGIGLGLDGLKAAAEMVKKQLGDDIILIYDHQKAGNDIPDMGKVFANKIKNAGIKNAILFPFAGPATQEAWTKALFDAGLNVLTGGIMTVPNFLVSEGGYIADDAPEKITRLACKLGVRHFVVPGNKPLWVQKIRAILVEELGENNFVLYAPGFITQKGDISECGQVAGEEWHAIVGSGIYTKATIEEMTQAAITVTKMIV